MVKRMEEGRYFAAEHFDAEFSGFFKGNPILSPRPEDCWGERGNGTAIFGHTVLCK